MDPPVIRGQPASTGRERIGWYAYDWANSAFATTVLAVFAGPYLTAVTKAAADSAGFVYPFGVPVVAGAFFPYVVSVSVLLEVVLFPILGTIADSSGRKKQMLLTFAYAGALTTTGFAFLQGTSYLFGGLLFLLANVAFGAANVFYDAFLPEIASPEERDSVSSRGWAIGYLGGGLLLALNLVLVSRADWLGLTPAESARFSLASAGVWWATFTLLPATSLRARRAAHPLPAGGNYLTASISELRRTARLLRGHPQTLLFLGAFLLYNDAIQSVVALSAQFGQEELGLSLSTLTGVILLVQFVGFFGALGFGWVAASLGSKPAILASLLVWTAILAFAAFVLRTATEFYVMGAAVGVVLGGSQALSRSVYSRMIPRGREAEFFSIYQVSSRGTSWIGPLVFGLALQATGSYRASIFSLAIFFVLGFLVLARVDVAAAVQEGRRASRPTAPEPAPQPA